MRRSVVPAAVSSYGLDVEKEKLIKGPGQVKRALSLSSQRRQKGRCATSCVTCMALIVVLMATSFVVLLLKLSRLEKQNWNADYSLQMFEKSVQTPSECIERCRRSAKSSNQLGTDYKLFCSEFCDHHASTILQENANSILDPKSQPAEIQEGIADSAKPENMRSGIIDAIENNSAIEHDEFANIMTSKANAGPILPQISSEVEELLNLPLKPEEYEVENTLTKVVRSASKQLDKSSGMEKYSPQTNSIEVENQPVKPNPPDADSKVSDRIPNIAVPNFELPDQETDGAYTKSDASLSSSTSFVETELTTEKVIQDDSSTGKMDKEALSPLAEDLAGSASQKQQIPFPKQVVNDYEEIQNSLDKDESLAMWLRADKGVKLGSGETVQSWQDPTRGISFFPTAPSTHTHELFGHEDHVSTQGEPVLSYESLKQLPLVEFPCSMETSNLTLTENMTLFFVVRPEAFLFGPAARGQRFFGHYPHGQFRFADASPSFFSGSDRKLVRHALNKEIRSGHGLLLVKYKLDGTHGTWVGVNRDPFYHVSEHPVEISKKSHLTVGGVDGGCGFRGGIAEVLVFHGVISSQKIEKIERYLEKRWWTDMSHQIKSLSAEVNFLETAAELVTAIQKARPTEDEIPQQESCNHTSADVIHDYVSANIKKMKPLFWLKASEGIVTTPGSNAIMQWESVAAGKLVSFANPVDGRVLPRLSTSTRDSCLKFVEFGCAMTLQRTQLTIPLTLYVVVRPSTDPESAHQRIFGHFPNGGFIFDGKKAGFKSKHGYLFPRTSQKNLRGAAPSDGDVDMSEFHILKFRISEKSGVEVGSSHTKDFTSVGVHHDALFSINQKLSLGGTNGGCEFSGGIGELMAFSSPLTDAQDIVVMKYLTGKWHHKSSTTTVMDQATPNTDEKCVTYKKGDTSTIMDWLPDADVVVSRQQREEWHSLVHKLKLEIARAEPTRKLLLDRTARAELVQHRVRIFGEPCKTTKFKTNEVVSPPKHIIRREEPVTRESIKDSLNQAKHATLSNTESTNNVETATTESATSSSTSLTSSTTTSTASGSKCKGITRPATNMILEWTVPSGASSDARYEWEDATDKVRTNLAKMVVGGPALQQYLKQQARYLNNLRDRLFADVCDDEPRPKTVQITDSSASTSNTENPSVTSSSSSSSLNTSITAKLQGASEKSTVAVDAKCDGNQDILQWKAPSTAPKSSLESWDDVVEKAKDEISKFLVGGKALETFLKTQIRTLKRARYDLFSSLCSNLDL